MSRCVASPLVRRTRGQNANFTRSGGIHQVDAGILAAYLKPLFDDASNVLERHGIRKSKTPIIAMGTGGMRTLKDDAFREGTNSATYERYCARLQQITNSFKGQAVQNSSFVVASGEQEAIYGWITANYSLGRL